MMSQVWRRTMEWLGLHEENAARDVRTIGHDFVDDEDEEEYEPSSVRKLNRNEKKPLRHLRSVAEEQFSKQVHLVEPTSFNDAQRIGEKFKANIPVIVNMQSLEGAFSQRLIDFICGLTYALGGSIQQVASKVFLLTPADVDVSAEQRKKIQEGGFFFNQF